MKKTVPAALAAVLALALAGCSSSGLTIFSNYRRIENIELVRTITADRAEDGVLVSIYGTAGEQNDARMYENTGPSIGVAMGELIMMPLGREAILSHTESMLVGEELARERLDECLDYIERYSETRLDTGLLIVRDSTARDLLKGLSGSDPAASDVIAGLSNHISRVGEGTVFTCREIAVSLAGNGVALIQCVRGEKEEKLFDARGELNLKPAGFAVVTGDGRTLEFLTEEETLGCLLLLSKLESKNVDLDVQGTVSTVSIEELRTSFEPVFDRDGALTKLRVRLRVGANLISMRGVADVTRTGFREEAQRELSGIVRSAAESAVRRSQSMGLDYLDLEGVISRQDPIRLEDMPEKWDDVFPGLPVEIEAESTLVRTFDIMDPPEIAGEEEKTPWEKLTESLKDN